MRAYGAGGLTFVDRFGVFLSQRPIRNVVTGYDKPDVLDIGCGYDATQLRALTSVVHTGVGIDTKVSDEARGAPGLRFLEGTAQDVLPTIERGSFDVVMLISVLEHLWEPLDALKECRRVLRPGGSLVVNVPNWRGKAMLELAAFRLKMSPTAAEALDDHKTYYDKSDLWPLLVKAGFKSSQIHMRYHKFGLNLFAVARAPAVSSAN